MSRVFVRGTRWWLDALDDRGKRVRVPAVNADGTAAITAREALRVLKTFEQTKQIMRGRFETLVETANAPRGKRLDPAARAARDVLVLEKLEAKELRKREIAKAERATVRRQRSKQEAVVVRAAKEPVEQQDLSWWASVFDAAGADLITDNAPSRELVETSGGLPIARQSTKRR